MIPDTAHVFSHAVDGSKPFRPDNVTGFFIASDEARPPGRPAP